MTGAQCLLQSLITNGIEVCFMNPGTSEMHFVAALDNAPGLRSVLCLYEGVCSGAADGYARMTGKPAATLLHLGPGLGNALSNLHNARKARSPVVNIVGQHATSHLAYDAPLTSDIAAFARTVSGYIRVVESTADVGPAVSETIEAAIKPPGQVATLIVPAEYSWLEAGPPARPPVWPVRCPPPANNIENAARILHSSAATSTAIVLGGRTVTAGGLTAAGRLAAATGVRFFIDRVTSRLVCGGGRFGIHKVPYFPEDAGAALEGLAHLILVEAHTPVNFFAYPNTPSCPVPEGCQIHTLAAPDEDGQAALETLVDACGAGKTKVPGTAFIRPETSGDGPLTPDSLGAALAACLPEGVIISDEMISSGVPVLRHLMTAAAHEQLPVTGGSIGQGLPVAVGAAVACPDRKVVALQADGSAMYTPQAIWTMAREQLDVTAVILANGRYRILDIEMQRTGALCTGPKANDMMDLGRPRLDFVALAQAMGIPATRAESVAEFSIQFQAAVGDRGPRLIEAIL
jgi:acetolactate synthase I/II/III large subunit